MHRIACPAVAETVVSRVADYFRTGDSGALSVVTGNKRLTRLFPRELPVIRPQSRGLDPGKSPTNKTRLAGDPGLPSAEHLSRAPSSYSAGRLKRTSGATQFDFVITIDRRLTRANTIIAGSRRGAPGLESAGQSGDCRSAKSALRCQEISRDRSW